MIAWPESIAWLVDVLSGPTWRHLLLALAHSVWQGALAAVLLRMVLGVLPGCRANVRYVAALVALCSVVIACLLTWSVLDLPQKQTVVTSVVTQDTKGPLGGQAEVAATRPGGPGSVDSATKVAASAASSVPPSEAADFWRPWYAVGAMAWLLGTGVMLLRTAWLVAGAKRLARGALLNDPRLSLLVETLRIRLGIRRAVRLIDAGTVGPAVLGILRPAVLLPAALVAGLPIDSLAAILAHELAHIRRHDYLVNLAQLFVESILFFNPAVWWISRQVRQEREACCDQLAVSVTGGTVNYAQTLAAWGERFHVARADLATGAVAYGNGGLLDRVKRLLLPDYRPKLRVSWVGLLGSTCLSALVVAVLWRGTQVGVAIAAELLSPAERLIVLDEERNRRRPVLPAEYRDGILEGTIRTSDGKPLPKGLHGTSLSRIEQSTYQGTVLLATPQFSQKIRPGTVLLAVHAPDYAPALVGPFEVRSGETLGGINIVLEPGFAARFQLMNDARETVTEASAHLYFSQMHGGLDLPIKADATGVVMVAHVSDKPVDVTIKARGYQTWSTKDLVLKPDAVVPVELIRGTPTTGVVETVSGEPIAGATIRCALQYGPGSRGQNNGDRGPVLATTDDAGRFSLDSLDDVAQYALLVDTPHDGRRLFTKIFAGDKPLRFTIGPDFAVRGRVTGDLSKLARDKETPCVDFNQQPSVQVSPDFSYGLLFSGKANVEVVDGEGRFEITNLVPGKVAITASQHTIEQEVNNPRTDVVINVDDQPQPVPIMRHVQLRFVGPDTGLFPVGQLQVIIGDRSKIGETINRRVDIENGIVDLDAYADGYVSYSARNIVGYWFADGMVDVTPGEGTLVHDVEVVPAGAVSGRVLNADGTPAVSDVRVGTHVKYRFSPQRWTSFGLGNETVGTAGDFFVSPIPLGAENAIVIVASRGWEHAVSMPVRVDAEHVSPSVELRFFPTQSAFGEVMGADGKPRANVPLRLSFRNPAGGTDYLMTWLSGGQGQFKFDDLSTGVDAYWVRIERAQGLPPIEARLNVGGPDVRLVLPD
ncbi:MAG TPA: M56 family metallopeptidase [Pirellulales bacterium]|jgi:beta-lactamase regulating signal transducer with metallopeptidase domain